jgi:hypothetical protein
MKPCKKCSCFRDNNNAAPARSAYCNNCHLERRRHKYRTEPGRKLKDRKWLFNNRQKSNKYKKDWELRNPNKVKAFRDSYVQQNWDYIIEKARIRHNRKYKENVLFRLKCIVRARLRKVLKTRKLPKINSFVAALGCSAEYFKEHLESLFQPGMTWENQGKWHIDHKMPLASAKTVEEIYKLCHYSNLQPLWAMDNFMKKDKVA